MREEGVRTGVRDHGQPDRPGAGPVLQPAALGTADGSVAHYDKRHLFRKAREHERYAQGERR
jgi:hypothetical protein